jgi:hypothetical protein
MKRLSKMQQKKANVSLVVRAIILSSLTLSAACTPTVYKPDVEKLSTNITTATTYFETLVDENVRNDAADRTKVIVGSKSHLSLEPNCSKLDEFIREQNQCLTSWSLFRQNPSASARPTCAEPAPFAPIPAELRQCRLGTVQGAAFEPLRVATAEDAQNHLRLAEALAAYATQLGAIVSASDGDQLEAATSDAGAAVQSLRDKLVAADPSAKPVDVGPIASFIGTGLRLALEARRFAILKNVAEKADPIVQEAAGRLSIYANQLYEINELRPAYAALDNAVLRAVPEPSDTFPARVTEAAAREQALHAASAVTPGDVFKAVADAHHELIAALSDPTRQIDALKKSVATLGEKTKALGDVLKKDDTKSNAK